MEYYSIIGKFVAQPGQRGELVGILLQAAQALESNPDCLHYVVSRGGNPDDIWVTEVWTDKAAHQASLEPEEVRAIIPQARPLISDIQRLAELTTVGGKGLDTRRS